MDLSHAVWRKATYSNGANASCVEVAVNLPGMAAIRDTKRPEAGAQIVSLAAFQDLLKMVRTGKYDL
ncbi:DUF397 domain-containing protein [Sphaerimonospora thailandensis]|uniref:DUF397 domain-containing protein n=1 Tax=Sphaerimonospora thailandensis TaxID=795644 RepID=A0A8J3REW3_9ACTN|nr:DUF397 domain-containing protein [Sphaerimonospora thailandensis]GIH73450.1 hypothetical protein Mth01_57030 [Sphaerimonospora thailandensis]